MVAHWLDGDRYTLICYGLFLVSRLRGVQRRWQQPHLRGQDLRGQDLRKQEWFFDVPVQAGFYEGPGREILRSYRQRVLWPFLLDIPVWAAVYFTGITGLLLWFMVALVPIIHLNHMMNVEHAQRRARAFAAKQEAQPVVALGLSLTPRRLRDLSNPKIEWTLAIATTAALLALVVIYSNEAGQRSIGQVFWLPALYLYFNLGILLIKQIIVSWRTRLPMVQRAEYQKAQDAMRSYYLLMCDWNRIVLTAGICLSPILLSVPAAWHDPQIKDSLIKIWLWGGLALCVAGSVWIEVLRKRLVRVGLQVEPVLMPDLMNEAGLAKWPVCYQPSAPTLILKGEHGYSLNLANATSYLGSAYLVGMIALFSMARLIH